MCTILIQKPVQNQILLPMQMLVRSVEYIINRKVIDV